MTDTLTQTPAANPTGSPLANPLAARDHARAMGGTVVESMPVLPPVATDLPEGVAPEDLVWEETIAAGGYATRVLARGTRLRLIDVKGDACAGLQVFNAAMPTERLNVADTVKVQWNAYLGAGKLLLSDMGRVLMSLVEDGAATHDCFAGTSNAATNLAKYGEGRQRRLSQWPGPFSAGRGQAWAGSPRRAPVHQPVQGYPDRNRRHDHPAGRPL